MTDKIPYGWAMTKDPSNQSIAYIDTGNSFIYKVDTTKDFELVDKIQVLDIDPNTGERNVPVNYINEIEFIGGYLWANKWQTNYIYKINPKNGYVKAVYDFEALTKRALHLHKEEFGVEFGLDDVLNGIAYDRDRDT